MILKFDSQTPEAQVIKDDAKDVTMQILVGPEDGSEKIIMRLFKIRTGGHTPFHQHPMEHVVKILKGRGIIVDGEKNTRELSPGMSLFVAGNEWHQFRNPYPEPLEFLCIILNPDKI